MAAGIDHDCHLLATLLTLGLWLPVWGLRIAIFHTARRLEVLAARLHVVESAQTSVSGSALHLR